MNFIEIALVVLIILVLGISISLRQKNINDAELIKLYKENAEFWKNHAREEVKRND